LGNLKDKHYLKSVDICGRTILKRILSNKMGGHGLESGEGQVVGCHEPLVPQHVGISRLVKNLFTSLVLLHGIMYLEALACQSSLY